MVIENTASVESVLSTVCCVLLYPLFWSERMREKGSVCIELGLSEEVEREMGGFARKKRDICKVSISGYSC